MSRLRQAEAGNKMLPASRINNIPDRIGRLRLSWARFPSRYFHVDTSNAQAVILPVYSVSSDNGSHQFE